MIGYLFWNYCTLYGCVKHTKEYKSQLFLFLTSYFKINSRWTANYAVELVYTGLLLARSKKTLLLTTVGLWAAFISLCCKYPRTFCSCFCTSLPYCTERKQWNVQIFILW